MIIVMRITCFVFGLLMLYAVAHDSDTEMNIGKAFYYAAWMASAMFLIALAMSY